MGKFVWVQKFLSTVDYTQKRIPAHPKTWSPMTLVSLLSSGIYWYNSMVALSTPTHMCTHRYKIHQKPNKGEGPLASIRAWGSYWLNWELVGRTVIVEKKLISLSSWCRMGSHSVNHSWFS